MYVHINAPPVLETREKPIEPRYCFNCRKVRAFKIISNYAEWYGWSYKIVCENGHVDGDVGFGRVRCWEDD